MAGKANKRGDKTKPLDVRERLFVLEYLTDLSAERAAIAAGYSHATARSNAFRWVSDPEVKPHVYAEIQRRLSKVAKKLDITLERVEEEIAKVAFASMRQFVTIDGDGQPRINLSDTDAASLDALSEVATETVIEGDPKAPTFVRKTRIKLHSKLDALEKLAQRHGFYKARDADRADAIAAIFLGIWDRGSKAPIRRDTPATGEV